MELDSSFHSNNSLLEKNLNAILEFADQIEKEINPQFIYNGLLLTCLGKFFTTKGAIYIFENNQLRLKYSKGFELNFLPEQINFFSKSGNFDFVLIEEELKKFNEDYNFAFFDYLGNTIESLGVLFLGKKITQSEYTPEEKKILRTIINIATPSIRNLMYIEKMSKLNKALNFKISQMNSLVELSKEFNYLLEKNKICKVLSYAILGNLMVSKYAIFHKYENEFKIIDGNIDNPKINELTRFPEIFKNQKISHKSFFYELIQEILSEINIELIVPMIFRNKIIGYILLGKKKTGLNYTENDKEFLEILASIAVVSLENAELFKDSLEKHRLEEDIKIAKEIQKNLLPGKILHSDVFDLFAVNIPSRQVGGDYFDIFRISDGRILILIGDVSGKGIAASLIMANCQAFVKSLSKSISFELSLATAELNELLCDNLSGGKFITFFWGILDESNRSFSYVNAGHNPPLFLRENKLFKFEKGGMLLGIFKHKSPYECETIVLKKNDKLLLFTDGITEAKDINDVEFSDEKLEEQFLSFQTNNSKEIVNSIIEDVKCFTKNAEQSDDLTVLSVTVK